jgi:polyhydroxybutyrate depolymerase
MSETFAAIGVVSGSMPENLPALCHPSRPVAVMVIFGKDDPLIPYKGGNVSVLGRKRGRVVSVEESVQFWAKKNHCVLPDEAEAMPDTDPQDGTRAYRRSGGKVEEILIEGGGHTWPGGWQYMWTFLVGKTSRDFNASRTLWKFFQKNHR